MSHVPLVRRGRTVLAWLESERVLLALVLLLGAALFLQHAFQYFLYDDEGSYAYASWRISLGALPYRDFVTPQMPAFLYWGALLVHAFGRSYVALRLATMLVTLLAGLFLYATNRELFGRQVALLALGLFLIEANVFQNARFFRPEALMLLFDLAGLYFLVIGERRGRLGYLALSGACFGAAILSKLFGFLPLAGSFLYLLYAWWRERRPWRRVWNQALALGLPALILAGGVALVFQILSPYFLTAVLEHHLMQGEQLSMLQRFTKAMSFYWQYIESEPLAIVLAAVGAGWLLGPGQRTAGRRMSALETLLIWQLPTALSFVVLSRQLMPRHLTYLAPALTTLAAVALSRLLQRRQAAVTLLTLALALGMAYPWMLADASTASWEEHDSGKLASLVQQLSAPNELVMADYPGINFAAGRASTHWAAGLSGGAAESGQIRGALLIDELEHENVSLVIICTAGLAHQMVAMVDYPAFRSYVQAHYALVDKVQCAYEQLEIYARRDTIALQPAPTFGGELALTGLRLSTPTVPAGGGLTITTRWQAQRAMATDYQVSLRLEDAQGHPWAQIDGPLSEHFTHLNEATGQDIAQDLSTSQWAPGEIVMQHNELTLPATLPPGRYEVTARLYNLKNGQVLAPTQGQPLPSGDVAVATVEVTRPASPPPVQSLPLAVSLGKPLSPELTLLGSGPLPRQGRAGDALALDLFWQAKGALPAGLRLRFSLAQAGQTAQTWLTDCIAGYPNSAWQPGDILLGHYALPLEGDLAVGHYALLVEAVDAQGQPLGQAVTLATDLGLTRPPGEVHVEQITHPAAGQVAFGGQIGFLGYDLSPEAPQPGGSLDLTLYWQCLQAPSKDYKVFVHLLSADGAIVAQSDSMPDSGNAPTSGWKAGQLLADAYELDLPATIPAGPLHIEIGLYDPQSGARLTLADGKDALVLPTEVK